jgi:cobalt-zinc-cadmium efflux system membrane fusion protein
MKWMDSARDLPRKKASVLAALGLVLVWGFGIPAVVAEEDDHAGHDHAGHADEDAHAHHETEAEEHGAETDAHAGHDHGAHGAEEEGLRLTAEQRKRFGIVVQPAGAGSLQNEVRLPGEIVFNEDRVVHMVPRVAGIARKVLKSVGDEVEPGEILAVIESRELADAKSEYLAARARAALAEKTHAREKALREKGVSSEQDYLEAEQGLAEARIGLRSAEQKLHALGLPKAAVAALSDEHDEAITRYEIRSPMGGVVTEKHISLGESLEADADIFTVVDARSVWVNLTVYTKNLGAVRMGQDVLMRVDHSGAQARGRISMVTPFVEESTRSATARVILDNSDGEWMPGTFVTGFISVSETGLPVVVPRQAVQNVEGRDVVFVEHEGGFEMTPVTTGRSDRDSIEISAGLEPGTPYAAQGAFQLKATVITSALGSHAGHGH